MQALLGLQQPLQRGLNGGQCSTSAHCEPSKAPWPFNRHPRRGRSAAFASAVRSRSRSQQQERHVKQPAPVEVAEFIEYHDDMFFGRSNRSSSDSSSSSGARSKANRGRSNDTNTTTSSSSSSSSSGRVNPPTASRSSRSTASRHDQQSEDPAADGQRIIAMHHLIEKQYQRKLRAFSRSLTPELLQELYATTPADMLPQLELILADAQELLQASMPAAAGSWEEEDDADQAAAATTTADAAADLLSQQADEEDEELTPAEAALFEQLSHPSQRLPDDFYSYLAELMPDGMTGEAVVEYIGSLSMDFVQQLQQLYNEMKAFEAAEDGDMEWAADKFLELSGRMEALMSQLDDGSSETKSSMNTTSSRTSSTKSRSSSSLRSPTSGISTGRDSSNSAESTGNTAQPQSASSIPAQPEVRSPGSAGGAQHAAEGGKKGRKDRVWGKALVRKRGRPPKQAMQ